MNDATSYYGYNVVSQQVGMDVIESHLLEARPHMTVSPRFAELMPADFVADLNRWMLARFGATEPQVMKIGRALYVAPSLLRTLEEEIRQRAVEQTDWLSRSIFQ